MGVSWIVSQFWDFDGDLAASGRPDSGLIFAPLFCFDGIVLEKDNGASLSTIGPETAGQNEAVAFATTHWSVVLTAQGESPAAQKALERLCRVYWWPLYSFVRRQGYNPEEAQDLTQGFFASFLERRDLDVVHREKGRLRCYLLASLKNFIGKAHRRDMTVKRGEGRPLVSLQELLARESADPVPADSLSPDRIYEHTWALSLLQQVLTQLEEEYRVAGKSALFQRLAQMLGDDPDRRSQAEIAQELSMTETAVSQAFYRLRQRYGLLVREEIAHTVAAAGDVEDELRHFIAVLRG